MYNLTAVSTLYGHLIPLLAERIAFDFELGLNFLQSQVDLFFGKIHVDASGLVFVFDDLFPGYFDGFGFVVPNAKDNLINLFFDVVDLTGNHFVVEDVQFTSI